jgi:acetate---CoA ligase (ADP-forming)
MSERAGSAGRVVLRNLTAHDYPGHIYLVGRKPMVVDDRPCLTDIDDLPEGIDLAVIATPAAAVASTLEGCVRRRAGAAVVFASGYAETEGSGGAAAQEALGEIAVHGNLALLGPNSIGYANFVDRFSVAFSPQAVDAVARSEFGAVAVIGQSGGIAAHVAKSLINRGVPISYWLTSGNEAGVDVVDLIRFLADDAVTRTIAVYAEQIRRPGEFVAAIEEARARAISLVILHPGRSTLAQTALRSHTGAMVGDYSVMRLMTRHAGAALVDTLEELLDVTEALWRFPNPPAAGPGIVTFSGAMCAILSDASREIGLDLPELSPDQRQWLQDRLPAFLSARNPLDIGTQPVLFEPGAKALLDDPEIGSLLLSMPASEEVPLRAVLAAAEQSGKPLVVALHNEESALPAAFADVLQEQHVILTRSPERGLRTLAAVSAHARRLAGRAEQVPPRPLEDLPSLSAGTQAEWVGKGVLAAAGIKIPDGGLANSIEEALSTARRIGFPVAAKAQSAQLQHKTDAQMVVLDIADEAGLRAAWAGLNERLAHAGPQLTPDGILIEAMTSGGVELVVGARRHPGWGAVMMVGLGGVWIEALRDSVLLPVDSTKESIVSCLNELRGARLLNGFRGGPAADIEAVAAVVARIGQIMQTRKEIMEIEINPLLALPSGAVALDALIVTR